MQCCAEICFTLIYQPSNDLNVHRRVKNCYMYMNGLLIPTASPTFTYSSWSHVLVRVAINSLDEIGTEGFTVSNCAVSFLSLGMAGLEKACPVYYEKS